MFVVENKTDFCYGLFLIKTKLNGTFVTVHLRDDLFKFSLKVIRWSESLVLKV